MKLLPATVCVLALSVCWPAHAMRVLTSELTPVDPTPGNTWFPAEARFTLDGTTVDFNIRFGVESVIPDTATIAGPSDALAFELGIAFIVIHSPGPWPDGYDGATMFQGTFDLPPALRDDFRAGLTTLELVGANAGDFTGPILPMRGDLSGDGDVDDEDLGLLFTAFTGPDLLHGPLTDPASDLSGDGDSDDEDLGLAFSAFTGPLGPASVPEPTSLALLGLLAMSLSKRRGMVLVGRRR